MDFLIGNFRLFAPSHFFMKNGLFQILRILTLFGIPSVLHADHPAFTLETGSSGPITALSAITLPGGKAAVSLQYQNVQNNELSDHRLEELGELGEAVHSTASITSYSLSTAYGFSGNFTMGFKLPYILRANLRESVHEDEHDDEEGESDHGIHEDGEGPVEHLGDIEGIGDLTLFGQYRLFHNPERGRHGSIVFGLKVPSGESGIKVGEELLEVENQPGSGSWDPFIGFVYTVSRGQWSFDINAAYTFATKGDRMTNLGDALSYNAAFSYRLTGGGGKESENEQHDTHEHTHVDDPYRSSWDIIAEFNGEWRDRVSIDGHLETHSGGSLVYLSIGSRYQWGNRWSGIVSAGIPVVRGLNGIQSEPAYQLTTGFSHGF
jgi:hypothetical protein